MHIHAVCVFDGKNWLLHRYSESVLTIIAIVFCFYHTTDGTISLSLYTLLFSHDRCTMLRSTI